jgi:hypothetical protein
MVGHSSFAVGNKRLMLINDIIAQIFTNKCVVHMVRVRGTAPIDGSGVLTGESAELLAFEQLVSTLVSSS